MPSARDVLCRSGRPLADQLALEERFFRSLRMPNWTYKTTSAGRLTDFDEMIARQLGTKAEVDLLDVGVASAVTTLDLIEALAVQGRALRAVALDRYIHGRLVRLGPWLDVLTTGRGEVLQVSFGRRVRPLPQGNNPILRAILQGVMDTVALAARFAGSEQMEVELVESRARANPQLELVEHDIATFRSDWVRRFDLVRAANVLNLAYFSESELSDMVNVLSRYLADGGLLAVCRTNDETGENHGSIFRVRESQAPLEEVDRIGRGSEIAALVKQVASPLP